MRYSTITCWFSFLFIFSQNIRADTITNQNQKSSILTVIEPDSLILHNEVIGIELQNIETLLDSAIEKYSENIYEKSKERDYLILILPILTLILGFFLNRGFDFFSEKRRIRREGERWIAELQCLDEPIQVQITSVEEFLKSHAIDKFETPELVIHQILDCEIFKSLDKSILLKHLRTNNKNYPNSVKLSNSVHVFISSLNFAYNDLIKRFHEYLNRTSRHVELFNEHLQQLMQSFAMYGVALEKRTGEDPLKSKTYSQIHALFEKHIRPYTENGNFELFNFQKEFILPLAYIIAVNRMDDDLKDITIHFANCNMEIKAIRMEKRYLTENFGKIIQYFLNSKENLDRIIDSLNKK